jgi:cysteine desulfurase
MTTHNESIYLDHAAATPIDRRVVAAMQPYFSELFYNPSSPYAPAISVRRDYEAAKQTIAQVLGTTSDELIMTAGATESINLAFGSVRGHVVVPAIEHHAVLAAAQTHEHTFIESDPNGRVHADTVRKVIRDTTELVSVALANNELGTIQPLRDIAEVIKQERMKRRDSGNTTPLYFHSDASQGVGLLDVNVARLGVDMLTINAAKVYGPKQMGLLFADRHIELRPQIVGGGQERGYRSGTENVAGTIGFATAMMNADRHRKSEAQRLTVLRDDLEGRLTSAFSHAVVSGHHKHRLPGHLHISFPGIDAERIVFGLEARGVLVATGSACAANKGTRSHVLTAVGMDDETADGSLRLSLGALSTTENTAAAADHIIEVVQAEIARTSQS